MLLEIRFVCNATPRRLASYRCFFRSLLPSFSAQVFGLILKMEALRSFGALSIVFQYICICTVLHPRKFEY